MTAAMAVGAKGDCIGNYIIAAIGERNDVMNLQERQTEFIAERGVISAKPTLTVGVLQNPRLHTWVPLKLVGASGHLLGSLCTLRLLCQGQ